MKQIEKDALIQYLEFHLVKFCERTERNLDPDAIGDMYDSAYGILNDMERSIQDIIDFDDAARIAMSNKKS